MTETELDPRHASNAAAPGPGRRRGPRAPGARRRWPGATYGLYAAFACLLACLGEYNLYPEDGVDPDVTAGTSECDAFELCDEVCVDLDVDSENCGECGLRCLGNTECVEGECLRECGAGCDLYTEDCDVEEGRCVCREGFVDCNGLCVDVNTDSDHCGGCFDACPEGQVCGHGECVPAACEGFENACPDACTYTEDDLMNCGACGVRCLTGFVCMWGDCVEYWEDESGEGCGPDGSLCFEHFLDREVCVDVPVCF